MEDLDRLAFGDIASTTETKLCDDIYHEDPSKKEEETHYASDSGQQLDSDISSVFSDRADKLSTTGEGSLIYPSVSITNRQI